MSNNLELEALMQSHELARRDIQEILHVPRETVRNWLLPIESSGYRPMPGMAIELLKLKLDGKTLRVAQS